MAQGKHRKPLRCVMKNGMISSMHGNIKLKLDLTPEQNWFLGNSLFATQMFRNHCVTFLRQRSFQKRAWLHANQNNQAYLDYLADNTKYIEKLKAFKKKHPTKSEQDANKADRPAKPARFHLLLESQAVAANQELTAQLGKAKDWLWKNVGRFQHHLEKAGITTPKNPPANACVFYNSLPLRVRKSLGSQAKNEGVLLYLLGAPRSSLVQVLQDLDKTFNQAYEKRNTQKAQQNSGSNGGSSKGFPKCKKLKRCGGIRFQLDSRLTSYATAWDKQTIQTPEFGVLHWRDTGYVLPKDPAKMMTIIKENNGDVFAVFYGEVTYNAKRLAQKHRALQRTPVVAPSPTIEAFFQEQTVAIDLNRRSGQLQVVCNIPQDIPSSLPRKSGQTADMFCDVEQQAFGSNVKSGVLEPMVDDAPPAPPNHVLSLLSKEQETKRTQKQARRERYIKHQQRILAGQDQARKKSKGKPRNPNGLHIKGKHSRRRQKTQAKLNNACAQNAHQKEVYYRLLVQKLIRGKAVVYAENLNVAGMLSSKKQKKNAQHKKDKGSTRKRKNNNRSQSKASFGLFMRILEEECIKNNVVLLKCDQFDPSSQFCHQCGHHWGRLDMNIRTITCPECGVKHDRDVNASINVQFLALYRYVEYLLQKESNNQEKPLNNIETLNLQHPRPWAERVHGEQALTSLFQISHEALMSYIKGAYPIKRIVDTIEDKNLKYKMKSSKRLEKQQLSQASCGNRHHPTFSKPAWQDSQALDIEANGSRLPLRHDSV